MVFAISWSGVSIASAKIMPMQMQHQAIMQQMNAVAPTQMMSTISVHDMKNHCLEMQMHAEKNHTSDMILSHDQHMQKFKDCHTPLLESKQLPHAQCQECALFACQSSIVWFNADIPHLDSPESSQDLITLQIFDQPQHLVGHWQEILRPPKA